MSIRTVRIPADCDWYMLPPTGWLLGVAITVQTFDEWTPPPSDLDPWSGHLRAEMTDPLNVSLFGRFTLRAGHGEHFGGIWFPDPLPNVNSACPYRLRFLDRAPALTLHIVCCDVEVPGQRASDDAHVWTV